LAQLTCLLIGAPGASLSAGVPGSLLGALRLWGLPSPVLPQDFELASLNLPTHEENAVAFSRSLAPSAPINRVSLTSLIFEKGVVTLIDKNSKLSILSSILITLSAFLLVLSIFFPWWQMVFFAPQYPEGLNIIVYPNKLEGEIDIVNGLNHYIGMENFSEENFPQLQYLSYLVIGLAVITLVVALLRNKKFLYGLIGLFMVGGILGVITLRKALVHFGTNLSPTAPIKIDPFVPPILGHNTVANFLTNSILGYGTYFLIAAFILLLIPLWKDRKK
jgi:hypothetical protein